jgi:signal transduction histidine kinase
MSHAAALSGEDVTRAPSGGSASSVRVRWYVAFVVATVLVALWTLQLYFAPPAPRRELPFVTVGALQAISWYTWLLLLPLILRVVRRVRLTEGGWRVDLPFQLIAAAGFAFAHSELGAFFRWLFGITAASNLPEALQAGIVTFASSFIRYWMIAGVYHAVSYFAELKEREVSAARLATSLAEARLESLRGKLEPHFLFNTLNSISALVRENPRGAEEMIGTLSDLLRASLASPDAGEITLAEELDLVTKYASVEGVRFGDRLSFEVDVPDDTRQARVPQLLLQPLVENAIRHGIAPREGPGVVRVSARRVGDMLHLTVEDDGVGLTTPHAGRGHGIGLGATRERLGHLYGVDFQMDVNERTGGGTRVTIKLPFRPASRES